MQMELTYVRDVVVAECRKAFKVVPYESQHDGGAWKIHLPFMYADGDHLAVVLKRHSGRWVYSDEGQSYFHLSLTNPERTDMLHHMTKTLRHAYGIEESCGELFFGLEGDDKYPIADAWDAIWGFIQFLLSLLAASAALDALCDSNWISS